MLGHLSKGDGSISARKRNPSENKIQIISESPFLKFYEKFIISSPRNDVVILSIHVHTISPPNSWSTYIDDSI